MTDTPDSLRDIPLTRIDGSTETLRDYSGQVLLVVNVASKCGLTPQYEALEELYRTYRDRGFVVLGFPSNDFHGQEPGSDDEIAEFCRLTYDVDFPMFSKVQVKGAGKHPLYQALIEAKPEAEFRALSKLLSYILPSREKGEIHWNFEKFLLDREGRVARRFAPDTKPDDHVVVEAIEELLG